MVGTVGSGFVSDWLPAVLTLAGLLCLGILVIVSLRGRPHHNPHNNRFTGSPAANHQTDQKLDEVRAATADLMRSAQKLAAQLDEKANRLEELFDLADERITVLTEIAATPSIEEDIADIEQRGNATSELKPGFRASGGASSNSPDPLTQAIYDLADAGRPATQIARELSEQVGKVELILALRGR